MPLFAFARAQLVLYEPIIFRKDLHQPECGTDPDAPLDVRNAAQSKNNPLSVMASRRGFLFPSKPHAKDYFLARVRVSSATVWMFVGLDTVQRC
jgi:hypothetical protein